MQLSVGLRIRCRRVRRALTRTLLTVGMSLVPARDRVSIYGAPDFEENSLAVALYLSSRSDWEVELLCSDPKLTDEFLDVAAQHEGFARGPITLRVASRRAKVQALVRSRLVLYTHAMADAPTPPRSRVHINLWHGTGAKRSTNSEWSDAIGADAMVGTVPKWLEAKMRDLGMPENAKAMIGYPRGDFMARRDRAAGAFEALSIDPARPTVVWFPTYRASTLRSSGSNDGAQFHENSGSMLHRHFVEMADRYGVNLLVKPHPRDAATSFGGMRVVSTPEIWDAGITLYEFLALTDAMISDYSSVWLEYLSLGKSIGLYCPDLDSYRGTRGFVEPEFASVAPELIFRSAEDVREFFERVSRRRPFREESLQLCSEELEVAANTFDATARLMLGILEIAESKGASLGGLLRRDCAS